MSIRLRMTLWYTGILTGTLLVFGIVLYFTLSYVLYENEKKQMRDLAGQLLSEKRMEPWVIGGKIVPQINLPLLDQLNYPGFLIQTVDMNGDVIQTSSQYRFTVPQPILDKAANNITTFTKTTIYGRSLLFYSTPIELSLRGGQTNIVAVLQVASIVDDIESILQTLLYILLVLGIVTIVIAGAFGLIVTRRALRPIENVIAAASQIGKGEDLDKRIAYNGPQDEIGRLTSTFNSMMGRIQGAYSELEESNRVQRRFVSDASHELRTPLTTIRGNVELLEKMWQQSLRQSELPEGERMEMSLEAMQDIAGEAARMSRLVNDLLSLARADAGLRMEKERLPIRPLVEDVARKAQLLPKKVAWIAGDLSALEGVYVYGNGDYLRQLMFIFIENAFKYTPEGQVEIGALRTPEQVGIRITDTGIGMDKDEVPNIFERFYRADPSRGQTSGTGLGLSIAKWIIDEHGGSIEVKTRKGAGSTFVIWLPVNFHHALQ
ncbi:sensor histidine kinase [Paenibacillus cymbidii]|uniref:sensor histidine kinase n=1 Tax=Paenibacillus cymbidii TaxID=1639034 RepID=UPI00108219C7|nr:HAMP domain-containing sensor histidine kinase [Paenibacillus cymbidii]